MAAFKYAIYENKSFLLLTGDVGCGKTTLINSFVNRLNDTVLFGVLSDPGLSLLDLLNHIAFLFGLDHTFKSKGEFIIKFTRFLNNAYGAKKRVLLIIDEAQRLSNDLLEEICMLSNIERQDAKLINIFFVGQDEFRQIVSQHPNRSLKQKLTFSCRITSLDEVDLEKYVQHRLKIAGTTASLFDEDALSTIYRYSDGNPRLINILCDLSLLTGFVQEKNIIDGDIVSECVAELQLVPLVAEKVPLLDEHPPEKDDEKSSTVETSAPLPDPLKSKEEKEALPTPVAADVEEITPVFVDENGDEVIEDLGIDGQPEEDVKAHISGTPEDVAGICENTSGESVDISEDPEISLETEGESLTPEETASLKVSKWGKIKRFLMLIAMVLMLVFAFLFFYAPEMVSDFIDFSNKDKNVSHLSHRVEDMNTAGNGGGGVHHIESKFNLKSTCYFLCFNKIPS
ncbi:hypothetical protein JCM12294_16570 [Desulfocicer niacini]